MTAIKPLGILVLLALAGCAGVPSNFQREDPCKGAEASFECQVYRYQNVGF